MPQLSVVKREKFAQFIVAGEAQVDAYTKAGYSEKKAHASAHRLARIPEVAARIAELRAEVEGALIEATILDAVARIKEKEARYSLLKAARVERAMEAIHGAICPQCSGARKRNESGKETACPRCNGSGRVPSILSRAPGGRSGFVVFTDLLKFPGPDGKPIVQPVFEWDTSLLNELSALEEQVAIERGEWKRRVELTGKDGGPVSFEATMNRMTDEELDKQIAERAQALGLNAASAIDTSYAISESESESAVDPIPAGVAEAGGAGTESASN